MQKERTFKAIILEDLKKRGHNDIIKKIKSITYETFSMGNAVRVRALDLFKSERETLDLILKSYQYGRFDAMIDLQYSERDDSKERQAKYVTLNHEFSGPLMDLAKKLSPNDTWRFLNQLNSYDDALKLLENHKDIE